MRRTRLAGAMDLRIIFGEFVVGIGAALAAGTGLALVRYYRRGAFPGQQQSDETPLRALTWAWAKVALGLIMVVWGVATLDQVGLF